MEKSSIWQIKPGSERLSLVYLFMVFISGKLLWIKKKSILIGVYLIELGHLCHQIWIKVWFVTKKSTLKARQGLLICIVDFDLHDLFSNWSRSVVWGNVKKLIRRMKSIFKMQSNYLNYFIVSFAVYLLVSQNWVQFPGKHFLKSELVINDLRD